MIEVRNRYLDLNRICESGQIFRMYRLENSLDNKAVFELFSADRRLRLTQDYEEATVYFDCSQEDFDSYWKTYFDLDRDYEALARSIAPGDAFLQAAEVYGRGIRVLKQDIWEMTISFIISQQKQIPSIRKCIEALCERFGEDRGGWYTFPTAEAIAAGGPAGLDGLSLGYRARYIYETSVQYLERGIDDRTLMALDYEEAKKYLCSFTGIGEKVANCILLFGAGFTDAFPIDVHIKDILYREYYLKEEDHPLPQDKLSQKAYEGLVDKYFGPYTGYRGIAQQWIFAYELTQKKGL